VKLPLNIYQAVEKMKFQCRHCGKEINREDSEIRKQLARGQENFFCNLKCVGALAKGRGRDQYSPFRKYHKSARHSNRKHATCRIGLVHLKMLWEHQQGRCAYTGVQLEHDSTNPNYCASLDRIDSNRGYEIDNIQFVSKTINYAKNMSPAKVILEFLDICKKAVL
jgi:hypothetical protein